MQKGRFFLLAAIASMFAFGCDTNVPTSEITALLTPEVRCGMSQGVPITTGQANKIKEIVNIINTSVGKEGEPDLEGSQVLAEDIKNLKKNDPKALVTFKGLIAKNVANGGILYSSVQMREIYQFVYKYLSRDDDTIVYCACGYEFCDANIVCSVDEMTKMPICSANTSADPSLSSLECNPMNIKKDTVATMLMGHQMPLLYKLSLYRDTASQIKDVDQYYNTSYKTYKANVDTDEADALSTLLSDEALKEILIQNYNASTGVLGLSLQAAGMIAADPAYSYDASKCTNHTFTGFISNIDAQCGNDRDCRNCALHHNKEVSDQMLLNTKNMFNLVDYTSKQDKEVISVIKDIFETAHSQNAILNGYSQAKDIIDVGDFSDIKHLLDCSTVSSDIKSTCERATQLYGYLLYCLNVGDADVNSRKRCIGFVDDCHETNGQRITGKACTGEVYIQDLPYHSTDPDKGTDYFAYLRKIAEEEQLKGKSADTINRYLIDQLNVVFNTDYSSTVRSYVREVQDAYKNIDINGKDTVYTLIFDRLSEFLNLAYKEADYLTDKGAEPLPKADAYDLHRKFFAWITVKRMSEANIAQMYTSTFAVKLDCIDQNTPIGDISGIKKYCITRTNLKYSIGDVLSTMKETRASVVNMADAIVMNSSTQFPITGTDDIITIDIPTVTIKENYADNGSAEKTDHVLSGDWLIMVCPSNASCHPASKQCGDCTNGDTRTKDGVDQICSSGKWGVAPVSSN